MFLPRRKERGCTPRDRVLFLFTSLAKTLGLFLLLFAAGCEREGETPSPESSGTTPDLTTNSCFIEGLQTSLDLDDPMKVFRAVFFALGAEEIIYPSENYFYFRLPGNGQIVWGSLTLSAVNRDDGILGFGYSVHQENPSLPDPVDHKGGGMQLNEAQGVFVEKRGDFDYEVEFEGKTVHFRLFDIGIEPPQQAGLMPEETSVSPLMDESGLSFHLIYNAAAERLYFLLNEDRPVPETFREFYPDILLGERTSFVFYDDPENQRRVLIGVKGQNVLKNNWYDGPFDQMPDNNIKTGRLRNYQMYLISHYPGLDGKIDGYGYYLERPNSRIAVAPYLVYFNLNEMVSRVDSCTVLEQKQTTFITCLTEQKFEVPEELEYLVR